MHSILAFELRPRRGKDAVYHGIKEDTFWTSGTLSFKTLPGPTGKEIENYLKETKIEGKMKTLFKKVHRFAILPGTDK